MCRHTIKHLPKKTIWIVLVLALVAVAFAVPIAAAAEPSVSLSKAADGLDATSAATRAQFAMLAVSGLGLQTASPATPTFVDVPRTSEYYQYVEGAYLSGLVNGLGEGLYGPDLPIARQQVATILARYLSAMELQKYGYISGKSATYPTLAGWFATEGEAQLTGFADASDIMTVHRPGVAYLAMHGIALGSDGWFSPLSSVTVAQCVSFIARTADVAKGFTTPSTSVPTITAISPTSGSYLGGTSVYIYGTGFASGATVRFGSVAATNVTVSSTTLIIATSPAGTAGSTVNVSVTTAGGTSPNTTADDFTYSSLGAPVITSLSRSYGWAGDLITIYGSNFSPNGLQVWFGSMQASAVQVTYVSSTRIDVVVPAQSVGYTVDVRVVTWYGTSANTSADNFTYYTSALPTVTGLSETTGFQGDIITVYGTNFVNGDTSVYFGSELADPDYVTYYSSTRLTVMVPPGDPGDTVDVRVVTDYGTSPDTSADNFTYYYHYGYGPTVSDVVPDSGWAGQVVSIYGSHFVDGDTAVYFGSLEVDWSDVTYYSSTHLTAVVPAGYSDGDTVDVRVVTDYGTSPVSYADEFTYSLTVLDVPVVDDISPDHGWVGNTVYIYGHNFTTAGLEVWFGSAEVSWANITFVNSTELKAKVPSGYSDGDVVRVRVVTDYGTSLHTGDDDFTYVEPGYPIHNLHMGVVQFSVAGADSWTSASSATFANGTRLDFRMEILDGSGDPVTNTNVSSLGPWLSWFRTWHGWPASNVDQGHPGAGGGSGPDGTTTDGAGFLYWSSEGGFSNASYTFALSLGRLYYPYMGGGVVFNFTWN